MIENLAPERATCPECGASFLRDVPWKRLCVPCWRKGKAGTPVSIPPLWTADMQAERDRLAREVEALRVKMESLQRERDKLAGHIDHLKSVIQRYAEANIEQGATICDLRAKLKVAATPALGGDMLKRMIRLCHPDLHPVARQAEATEVTQALNAMRGAR